MNTKIMLTAVAMAAATLVACGGGGGGGGGGIPFVPPPPPPAPPPPPPPPAPPPPDSTSSAACFNQADLNEGTTLVAENEVSSQGQTYKQRVTTVTRTREAFANANPVRQVRTTYNYTGGAEAVDRLYIDFVDGKVVRYGARNGGENADPKFGYYTNEPPVQMPVMAPGQSLELNYVMKTVQGENGEIRFEQAISSTTTYVGREDLATPMGTFNACKYAGILRTPQADGSTLIQNQENWIAAEGPYRGQILKLASRAGDVSGMLVVTQMTYTPK